LRTTTRRIGYVLLLTLIGVGLVALCEGDKEPEARASADRGISRDLPELHMADADERNAARLALERVQLEMPPAPAPNGPDAEAVRGCVLDTEGSTVAGATVMGRDLSGNAIPGCRAVESGPLGAFVLMRPRHVGIRVGVGGNEWTAVLEPQLCEGQVDTDLTVVVARIAPLRGRLIDADDRGVPGASVRVLIAGDLRTRIPSILDRCVQRKWVATTDADGAFAWSDTPAMPVLVRADAVGRGTAGTDCTPPFQRVQLVLDAWREKDVLDGVVRVADGRPAIDAIVQCGHTRVRVDSDGKFEIDLHRVRMDPGTDVILRAGKEGYVPVELACDATDWRRRAAWPAIIVLALSEKPLAIAGRTARPDGSPVHCEVDAVGRTPWPDELGANHATNLLGSGPSELRGRPRTDEFCVPRLARGAYRLRVWEPDTMQLFVTQAIEAGSLDCSIRLPPVSMWPGFQVKVVDRRSHPVAGADWLLEGPSPEFGVAPPRRPQAGADATGTIESGPVTRMVDTLLVRGPGLADYQRFTMASVSLGAGARVTIAIAVQARIELVRPDEPIDAVGFLNVTGQQVAVVLSTGNAESAAREVRLEQGRSQTFRAPDDLATLVLWSRGTELRRVPVVVQVDGLNVLRP
jgi:hypothetical protein